MKRILTVGRDYSCDIHINDSSDIVSRNHATIEVGRCDKYFIIDTSSNGTYVNGIRIPAHQRYELKRGDEVSLAHATLLDWSLVPKDNTIVLSLVATLATLAVAAAVVFAVMHFGSSSSNYDVDNSQYTSSPSGSVQTGGSQPITVDGDEEKKDETPKQETKDKSKDSKKEKSKPSKKETKPAEKKEEVVDAIY